MNRIISTKLYLEGIRKIKIPGIAAAIAVICLNAIIPIIAILENQTIFSYGQRSISSVSAGFFMPFSLLMPIFAGILTYSMFSFLNERNRSDFYHAIPETRTCVYLSFMASIVTWIVGILLAGTLVNSILFGMAKYYAVNISVVLVTPLIYLLASLMIVGFVALAMTMTGTVVSNVLIFTLLFCFVRTVGFIFVTCVEDMAPIFEIETSFFRFLSVDFFLPLRLLLSVFEGDSEAFTNIPLILYSIFVTLLLVVLAGFSYKIRRSESAGKSAPSRTMQHIYRTAVSLPFFLFIAMAVIMGVNEASVYIALGVLAMLVYCIFELMTTKKIKVLVKSLPLVLIPILLSVVFYGGTIMIGNMVLDDIPSHEEVTEISIADRYHRYLNSYRELRVADSYIDSKKFEDLLLGALERRVDEIREGRWGEYAREVMVRFRLTNGKVLGRKIRLNDKEVMELQDIILSSEEYLEGYLALPSSREIDSIAVDGLYFAEDEDIKRIWASFILEYSGMSDRRKMEYLERYEYDSASIATINVSGTYNLTNFYDSYPIMYEFTPNTAMMLLEMMCENERIELDVKAVELLREMLKENKEFYFDINFAEFTGENAGRGFTLSKEGNNMTNEDILELLDILSEGAGRSEFTPESRPMRISMNFSLIKEVSEEEKKDDFETVETWYSFDAMVALDDTLYERFYEVLGRYYDLEKNK